jgi:FkbM family methyltransferase
MYRGLYERAEVKILRRLVKPGMTCVDVGANVGWYTRLFSEWVGPTGRVEAFEPSPGCLPHLNDLPANVTLHACALGAQTATAQLLNTNNAVHSGQATLMPGVALHGSATVEVRRLDDMVTQDVDVLKIDVEGWEAEVLAGAQRLIADRRFRYALIEVSPEFGSVDYAYDLLALGGYSAWRIGEAGRFIARPRIMPVGAIDQQFNLLLVRDDAPAPQMSIWPLRRPRPRPGGTR